jgi:branched-chain amino acid transport system substrate-binding protein
VLFQTSAPSNAGQYSSGIGAANTEGVFYTVSWDQQAKTPQNPQFVAKYKSLFNGDDPAEDAADAFAAAQVLQTAAEKVGSFDQNKIRDYLHANAVTTILGPLKWDDKGQPQGQFILAQWQSGKVQVVAPASAATSQKVVYPKPGWH